MNAIRSSMTASAEAAAARRPGPWRRVLRVSSNAMARAVGRLGLQYRKRRAMERVQALPNHVLKDIGIDRSEIASVVHGLGRDPSRHNRMD